MVRLCQVCGKTDGLNPEISFHRFPVDLDRRRMWLDLVGFKEDINLPKVALICSNHFKEDDLFYKSDGKRYLQPSANPQKMSSPQISKEFSPPESKVSCSFTFASKRQKISDMHSQMSAAGPSHGGYTIKSTIGKEMSPTVPMSSSSSLSSVCEDESDMLQYSGSLEGVRSSSATVTASEQKIGRKESFRKPPRGKQTLRRRHYIGDLSSSDFSTPIKAKRNFMMLREAFVRQRKQVRGLRQTVRRLKKRIHSLNGLMKDLNEKSLITSESAETTIRASLSGTAGSIFERALQGVTKKKYDPALRAFALTLSFYSPRAYNYVRETLYNSLPHLGTISRWFKSVDGSPGFTQESLLALRFKQEEAGVQGKSLLCNLVLDEMSIRQQIEWTGKKFTGYVDIGTHIDSDVLPEAKEVLVFMLVCLNMAWKIPVGYFFLDGLTGSEKAELVKRCLQFVHETGITVTSLTFDGAPVNFVMANTLGADIKNVDNLKTCFKHPVTGMDVFIFLDPCHMIKLVRNAFGSQKMLRDTGGAEIRWSFLENLVQTQNLEGLHAATKIRLRHLEWAREKMKVRLATQTLSRSVADALLFLGQDLKLPEFQNCEGTANFILNFNNLFDIFNSRNRLAKYYYKKPLSPDTAHNFFDILDMMENYITGLQFGTIPVVHSPRRTGFLGFLVCIRSLKELYTVYVAEKKLLKYILTYKLSQDHIELFFGTMRSKGGFNNNPSARQFEASYKRLLVHTEIAGPNTGNAINLEKIPILTAGTHKLTMTENGDDLQKDQEYLSLRDSFLDDIRTYNYSAAWDLTVYTEDIVSYISGFVVRCLKKTVVCAKCKTLLETERSLSILQERKRYGKLINPSAMVVGVCKTAEKYFRFFNKTSSIFNKNIENLLNILIINTMQILPSDIFDDFGDHQFDDEPLNSHTCQLIKFILINYFTLRIHYETSKKIDQKRSARIRSINTKIILFRHE